MSQWMDSKLQRNVQKTVQQHCSNCHSGNKCLLTQQPTCFYFRERQTGEQVQRCVWFEQAVIDNEPAVKAEYERKLRLYLGESPTEKTQRRCLKCGNPFERTSNRNVYCVACKSVAARESDTQRKRTYRQKKRAKPV